MIAQLDTNEDFRQREFRFARGKSIARTLPMHRCRVARLRRCRMRLRTLQLTRNSSTEHLVSSPILAGCSRIFLGAETEEISLSGPTSSGLNAVANGLDWKIGDEVVCYLDDYPADVYPWLGLERSGVTPVLLQTERLGEITPEIVERALTKRTRLVALASANNASGYRIDVETIGKMCAERGILFSVDGIQTVGAFSIPLRNVDFLSAGAQKWMLGPSGAGILFVKKSRQELLRPMMVGGWNVTSPN